MSIDMEQFKVTFVEESLEGLDIMESVLLDMHPGAADAEAIDNIFRAAHSIKGGAATFGLGDIADFTHVVETLLDEVRNGDRDITQDAIVLFLSSVDCIREMLSADQNDEAVDQTHIEQVKAGLDKMLGSEQESEAVSPENNEAASGTSVSQESGWQIIFKPFPGMLRTGNDVVRMFRELAGLGDFTTVVDAENLPPLVDMDPEEACLNWHITLNGDIEKSQISEIFEWVEDDCELEILPLA
ncbi:MAG: chemotaxis protein CheA, partial [Gammaproteobacteria bacterium]|nr:chemotaxis protein CheA [Gammaproteobacteria bacterium]